MIRYANDKDLSGVQNISDSHGAECYDCQWEDRDYRQTIRTDDSACIVADVNGLVVGFVVVDTSTSDMTIKRMAIDPHLIRCKIGAQLIHNLKQRLSMRGLRKIVVDVPEENLNAQKFFRSQGLKARKPIIKLPGGKCRYRFHFEFMQLFSGRS